MKTGHLPWTCMALALLCFVACGDEAPAEGEPGPGPGPSSYGSPGSPAPGSALALTPEAEFAETPMAADMYIYTPVGKRDPFRSSYKEVKPKEARPEGGTELGILTQYELDQLKLVAVISGIPQPKAMVEDPEGKGHVVKIGTRMGKNFGRVVRIRANEVIVAEDYRDWNQRLVTNYIHIALVQDKNK